MDFTNYYLVAQLLREGIKMEVEKIPYLYNVISGL